MAQVLTWQEIAARKQEQRLASIPPQWILPPQFQVEWQTATPTNVMDVPAQCGILTAREIELTENYDATDLIQMMCRKEVSSLEVTTAFCKRAAIAQQLVNCLTEIFFDEALARAKELDDYLARTGKPMGLLHGLPVSIKDGFNVKGHQSVIGLISRCALPPEPENSPMTDVLLACGAVLYVKTNLPQTMMVAEGENNVFGRTLNPRNSMLTPGGSSSGEGALLGIRGSIVGIGTDIAGSIRIPAACNGRFGFKPSAARFSTGGQAALGRAGSPGILSSSGPLCTSARDLSLVLRAVISAKPWDYDSNCLAIPWHEPVQRDASAKLRIGVLTEDPAFPLHPPVRRAYSEVAAKLAAAGHELIPLPLESFPDLTTHMFHALTSFDYDNARTVAGKIASAGEPLISSVLAIYGDGSNRQDRLLDDVWTVNKARNEAKMEWLKLWRSHSLDVILSPGMQSTAPRCETRWMPAYLVHCNYIDAPSAVIPYGQGNAAEDKNVIDEATLAAGQGKGLEWYRPEDCEGMPAHVQLIGRPYMEEELAANVELVAKDLGV